MNYYNRFPGDYARDTQHLSLDQHGAYSLLLDTLYATEKPLPKDIKLLFRLCHAATKRQQNAVKSVLSEFFFKNRLGYSNKRYEKELKRSRVRIKSARENGKNGGRPRKTKPNGKPEHNPAKSSPSPIPHPSQDQKSFRAAEREKAAAAFLDIGFDAPFGHPQFQSCWLQNYDIAKTSGTWLTMAMEQTIQECNEREVGVPPQFFSAKRTVETLENEEFRRKHHRTPL